MEPDMLGLAEIRTAVAPVASPASRDDLAPQAATAVSARTRETGTGRAGTAAAYAAKPAPARLYSSVMVSSPWASLATHMCAPSKAIPSGLVSATKEPSVAPAGDSSVTPPPLAVLATHMFVPSNAIA